MSVRPSPSKSPTCILPDRSAAEVALAFKQAYRLLAQRIGIFAALPFRSLDRLSLQAKLKEIGKV